MGPYRWSVWMNDCWADGYTYAEAAQYFTQGYEVQLDRP